ncbi:acyl-CoA dehydrogenase, partial [Pseudomonas aeruginosa]
PASAPALRAGRGPVGTGHGARAEGHPGAHSRS